MYICESLRLQGENKYLSVRYSDLIEPQEQVSLREQQEQADEIIENLVNKFGKGG